MVQKKNTIDQQQIMSYILYILISIGLHNLIYSYNIGIMLCPKTICLKGSFIQPQSFPFTLPTFVYCCSPKGLQGPPNWMSFSCYMYSIIIQVPSCNSAFLRYQTWKTIIYIYILINIYIYIDGAFKSHSVLTVWIFQDSICTENPEGPTRSSVISPYFTISEPIP